MLNFPVCDSLKLIDTVDGLVNNGINYLPTGAGFLPSTVPLFFEEIMIRRLSELSEDEIDALCAEVVEG